MRDSVIARAMLTVALATGLSLTAGPGGRVQTQGIAPDGGIDPRSVIDQYCVTCHNARILTAGLALDSMDPGRVGARADIWEKVARKFRTHEMPPPGRPRPDRAIYEAMSSWLETALDRAAADAPRPGRVPIHRLNRVEYANAIRDLLGIELDGQTLLFADQPAQEGFQNIASVLSVSPALLENYLTAASKISRLAVADPAVNAVVDTYRIPAAMVQDDRAGAALPFGSRGGLGVRHHFPADGEYTVKIQLRRQLYLYLIGMGDTHQIDLRVDGERVARFSVGGEAPGGAAPDSFAGNTQGDPDWEEYMHTADAGLEVRVPVTAGTHEVGVSFVRRVWELEGVLQPPQRGFARTTNELYYDGSPAIDSVSVGGPYTSSIPSADVLSRRKVFVCSPADAAQERPCARDILSGLSTRAYRRAATDREVQMLMAFYEAGSADGGFEGGVRRGLERILVSPSFLFRVERAPADAVPGEAYRLDDDAVASRLSFFLWSSIPDDELRQEAARGALRDPDVLDRQVARMLADSRSSALVDNFATQWLQLGRIAGVVPDADAYPEFDENLRQAMQQETALFLAHQIREDRSVLELLTAKSSYVNARLARHYQIPDVYGSHFRPVTFEDGVRGGLLGQASVLTVTSYPNRTSPVLRGKWLLENVLGAPAPAPPPDVPSLEESSPDAESRSLRERMEQHRSNPVCAACHVRMDPLGFALENFDALGKWRAESDGHAIDAVATLPDGTTFDGVAGLKALLADHQEEFVRTFTEHLLSYAIGRGIEYDDLPAVRRIVRDAAANDYRWSALIAGVVRSVPFAMSEPDPGRESGRESSATVR